MGSMTENIADKAINDTRIVKQFTNPVKEPIDICSITAPSAIPKVP